MIRTPLVTALGLFSLLATAMSTSAQASPASQSAAKKSTDELTVAMLSHFKNVVSAAASASDKTNAKKAVVTITNELTQVDTLTNLLAKSSNPTEAQMATVAEASARMNIEMRKLYEAMVHNLKNKEVRTLIEPSMKQFDAKAGKAKSTMDKLFPPNKMLSLVKAASARIQIQKTPK